MNLYDIIAEGQRVVILADDNYIYTWNLSLSLQRWKQRSVYESSSISEMVSDAREWDEVDIRILSDEPASCKEAQDKVRTLWMCEHEETYINDRMQSVCKQCGEELGR